MTASDVVTLHAEAIGERTRVLVLPHIDNQVGLRHPLPAIAKAARERGVRWIAVDAAQSVGMIPVDVGALGVDFYATSTHKWLQSPKGLGLLVTSERGREALRPMWVSWGQRRWSGSARPLRGLRHPQPASDPEPRARSRRPRNARLGRALGPLRAPAPPLPRARRGRLQAALALTGPVGPVGLDPRRRVGERSSREVAKQLYERHGIVLRPFEGRRHEHAADLAQHPQRPG